MTQLDRYLARAVLSGVLLVVAVLLSLGGLFEFMGQQDDIGIGSYTAIDALQVALLSLPQQAWELLPISALIGALLGLGNLARGSEIIVMRAAGLSVWRIARGVAYAGGLLVLLSLILGELLAPPMQQLAREHKAFSKFSNVSFAGPGGAWIRDGELILNVEQQLGDRQFGGLYLYRLDADHRLRAMGRANAASAELQAARGAGEGRSAWRLDQYAESEFAGDRVVTRREESRGLSSNLSAEFVGVAAASPGQLPSAALWRMIDYLEANDLEARQARFALWSRIARTLAVLAAVLLALPFVFGTLRSAGAGARVAVGFVLGIAFFMLQKVLESGTVVFAGNPVLLAWVPTSLMAITALVLLARTR